MRRGILSKLLLLLFLLIPLTSRAEISRIVFVTDSQTVTPGNLSGALTIQTQDSSGASFKTPETLDLEFLSTSPTGQFLGTTGSSLTKSMSTNTSNKNFAYKDTSEGVFTITVNATGRASGGHWSASQTITVASDPFVGGTGDTGTSTATTTDSVTAPVGVPSAHYSFVPIADSLPQKFTVSAGRDRLGTTGVPLVFKALPNTDDPNANYTWAFGDGVTGEGRDILHTYSYPGTYNVILNARLFEYQAVARIKVVIVDPALSVASANGSFVEVKNSSAYETNLYGWRLEAGGKIFEFPKDTILTAGESIKFPATATKLTPSSVADVKLRTANVPASKLVPAVPQEMPIVAADTDRTRQLADVGERLSKLERQTYLLMQKQEAVPLPPKETPAAASVLAATATPSAKHSWLSTLKRFFQIQ